MIAISFRTYVSQILAHLPWTHWVVIAGVPLALTVFLLTKKKSSVYGAAAIGLTIFIGLLLLDSTVVNRCFGTIPKSSGVDLSFRNFFQIPKNRWVEFLPNFCVFIPFGFFLSEFLSTTKRIRSRRRLGLATLAAFGISLSIECLQRILHVGFFELTDLVLNTVGGCVGGGVSVMGRWLWMRGRRSYPIRPKSV